MAITPADVNLQKFLDLFTFTSDATPGQKIVLADAQFLNVASLLKLDFTIQRAIRKMK